jgi:hypothetical protein
LLSYADCCPRLPSFHVWTVVHAYLSSCGRMRARSPRTQSTLPFICGLLSAPLFLHAGEGVGLAAHRLLILPILHVRTDCPRLFSFMREGCGLSSPPPAHPAFMCGLTVRA